MALGKPQRQHRIARLLEEQVISSQVQLVELLGDEWPALTQATVSRDLEELGAVKVRIPGGQMAYAIPELAKDRETVEKARRALVRAAIEIDFNANGTVPPALIATARELSATFAEMPAIPR